MLNPIEHAHTPEDYAVYRTEPYVVAADVYSLESRQGRGGWNGSRWKTAANLLNGNSSLKMTAITTRSEFLLVGGHPVKCRTRQAPRRLSRS